MKTEREVFNNIPLKLIFAFLAVIIFFSGCSGKKPESKNSDIRRIVSLSPSITKQIIDLEGDSMLVGITSYCPKVRGAVIVGNLTNPVSETILKLNPDIVFASDEDAIVQKLSALENSGIRIHKFKKNYTFERIIENYRELAVIIGKEKLSLKKSGNYTIIRNKNRIENFKYKAAFFISHRPLIAASSKTYINGILNDSGLENIYADLNVPYPVISIETVVKSKPDFIFSMDSDPAGFFKSHLEKLDIPAINNKRVIYIDPEFISSYTPGDYINAMTNLISIVKKIK